MREPTPYNATLRTVTGLPSEAPPIPDLVDALRTSRTRQFRCLYGGQLDESEEALIKARNQGGVLDA